MTEQGLIDFLKLIGGLLAFCGIVLAFTYLAYFLDWVGHKFKGGTRTFIEHYKYIYNMEYLKRGEDE